MNLLSPDDILGATRRKSLCNGTLLTLTNKNAASASAAPAANKKKERRRGSFSEPHGRRASLVSRWFKHISDAAEQYKPRSKSSHDVVEDPASATLPHSNTKESLESTPERTSALYTNNNAAAEATATPAIQPQIDQNISINISPVSNGKSNLTNNNTLEGKRDGALETNNNNTMKDDNDENEEKDRLNAAQEERRESVYSNNSNNTRTLMQHCPLLEPSEIQISISPAHTAEPVVTPTERLRRLDEGIRGQLTEKQKIICDMFRVPHEHFTAIADIAGQPEAPKDTSDIVLAAFAQVQSLTEVLTEHMNITAIQEISAVSTAVCDQCHRRSIRSQSPLPSSIASTNTGTTIIRNSINNTTTVSQNLREPSEDTIIQEDDGYCEIDELRLPSLTMQQQQQPQPPPPPPPPNTGQQSSTTSTPELVKRQSTISADSIPEESEQDITADEQTTNTDSKSTTLSRDEVSGIQSETISEEQPKTSDDSSNSEQFEVNDTYDSTTSLQKPPSNGNKIPSLESQLTDTVGIDELCGPNRFSHAHSLEPSVPCHILTGFITALNSQISLLLPKINERDIERERLRRENQHLRELLNSMHERQRVEEEKETPETTKSAAEKGESSSSPDGH